MRGFQFWPFTWVPMQTVLLGTMLDIHFHRHIVNKSLIPMRDTSL